MINPSQAEARSIIGLRPYLSDSRPHIGEKMARLMKLQPNTIPAHIAMASASVTPSSSIYSGIIGAIWLMPIDTMNDAAVHIHMFFFQISI